jgi:hypothetical protein
MVQDDPPVKYLLNGPVRPDGADPGPTVDSGLLRSLGANTRSCKQAKTAWSNPPMPKFEARHAR